jgi:hypothetical protein
MKIVQSFWTKPMFDIANPSGNKLNGGWPHRKFNYYSWMLSCLQLKEYYDSIELVTDSLGKEILIDKLQLPYTSVVTDLDRYHNVNSNLWALGKIHAYGIQTGHFLHVDNDVYISHPFSNIADASVVAQNREMNTDNYSQAFLFIIKNCDYIPAYIKGYENEKYIPGTAMGVVGGTDIAFIQEYVAEVKLFLARNTGFINSCLGKIPPTIFNVFFEQVIFYLLAKSQQRTISYLFPDMENTTVSMAYPHEADKNNGFVHSYAGFKERRIVYSLIEQKLAMLYPEYYQVARQLVATYEL